jgi:hypothetical protein
MEDDHFSENDKSKTSEVKCDIDAHCFFNVLRNVNRQVFSTGQTVNLEFYLEDLTRLRKNVRRKRPELWKSGDWFLHHDDAPAHTALIVTRYLASLGMTVVHHPPYSPDLAPCDFFLFPTLKERLKKRLPPWRRGKQLRRRHSTSSFSSSGDPSQSEKNFLQVYCLQWRLLSRG